MAGYIGFFFELACESYYDWAYNNVADEGIVIGQLVSAPEPMRAVLMLASPQGILFRSRR